MAIIATPDSIGENRRVAIRRASDNSMTAGAPVVIQDTATRRLSWPGVWGGVFMCIGMLFLLSVLGLAVGVSAVDPATSEPRSFGVGASLWAAVSLLVALYVGGLASTRISAVTDKTVGAMQGALVWILSSLVIMWLASAGIGLVAGGAFKLIGGATQAVGAMVTGNGPDLSSGTVDQVVERLRDPETIRTLSMATGMSEQEVSDTLAPIADKAQAARDNPAQALAQVRRGVQGMIQQARDDGRIQEAAVRAKSAATKAAWFTFIALVVSLIAAVLGAIRGRSAPLPVEPG